MPLFLWHVRLDPDATFEAPIAADHEAGVYVIGGNAEVGAETRVSMGELAVLAAGEGGLRVRNMGSTPLDVMVLGGAPAEGPLVFHGPFVMNSVDQIRAAEIAYRTGKMGDLD
jgi:redox-sensitive bicupin YhaK (pirin superfamily)